MIACLLLTLALGIVLGWRAALRRVRPDLVEAWSEVSDLCDALLAANAQVRALQLALAQADSRALHVLLAVPRHRLVVTDAATGRTLHVTPLVPYVVALGHGIAVMRRTHGVLCDVVSEERDAPPL